MSTPVIRLPWLPFNYDGLALGWVIIIRKGKDEFIVHEEEHIKQQKLYGFWTYMWRYWTDKKFQARMEYNAYKVMGWDRYQIEDHLLRFYGIEHYYCPQPFSEGEKEAFRELAKGFEEAATMRVEPYIYNNTAIHVKPYTEKCACSEREVSTKSREICGKCLCPKRYV